jgi:hypothetical protein
VLIQVNAENPVKSKTPTFAEKLFVRMSYTIINSLKGGEFR